MPPDDKNQGDPFAEAAAPSFPVARDTTERIFGMGVRPGGSLDQALQQHHAERAAQAQMYRKNVSDALGQLHYGKNPTTGEDLSEDEIAKLTAQKDYALDQYAKLIGVNKDAKGAIDKARGIIDFITGSKKRQAQMAAPPTPNYATTVGDAGVQYSPQVGPPQAAGPTPQYPTNISDAGVTYDPRKAMTPPPLSPKDQARQDAYKQRLSSIESSIGAPFNQQGVNFNTGLQNRGRTMTADVQTRDALVRKVIPQADWDKPYIQDYKLTGQMSRGMISKLQKTNMVDPETMLPVIFNPADGSYTDTQGNTIDRPVPFQKPVLIGYKGPNGEPLFGTEAYSKLYDQEGNQLPPGTQKFYPALADKHTVNYGFRQVIQPDGRIVQVPTVTVTDTTRGGQISAPPKPSASNTAATPQGANQKPNPPVVKAGSGAAPKSAAATPSPAAASNASYASMMGLPKGSRVVGGKVPAGVQKAYSTYNGSQERYAVMEQALPKALKGDQQAMINLLYNHIGMTTGLQKGARITQDLIHEAENSAPWMATLLKRIGVDNEFEISPTALRGVVLDSATMHNMIDLAKERRDEDQIAWQREIAAAKGGYGMGLGGDTTPAGSMSPPPTPGAPSAAAAGGNLSYTDGGKNYNIPKEMIKDFLKDHPNAKPR